MKANKKSKGESSKNNTIFESTNTKTNLINDINSNVSSKASNEINNNSESKYVEFNYTGLFFGIFCVLIGIAIIVIINTLVFNSDISSYYSTQNNISSSLYEILTSDNSLIEKISNLMILLSNKRLFYAQFISLSSFLAFLFLALYVKWIAWNYFIRN